MPIEARGWDTLHAYYDMRRINHTIAFSKDGASTNQAESYFSRLRRAEIGTHHRVSGQFAADVPGGKAEACCGYPFSFAGRRGAKPTRHPWDKSPFSILDLKRVPAATRIPAQLPA